jgi:hypothetical protein
MVMSARFQGQLEPGSVRRRDAVPALIMIPLGTLCPSNMLLVMSPSDFLAQEPLELSMHELYTLTAVRS